MEEKLENLAQAIKAGRYIQHEHTKSMLEVLVKSTNKRKILARLIVKSVLQIIEYLHFFLFLL
jgi:hypothetical protein